MRYFIYRHEFGGFFVQFLFLRFSFLKFSMYICSTVLVSFLFWASTNLLTSGFNSFTIWIKTSYKQIKDLKDQSFWGIFKSSNSVFKIFNAWSVVMGYFKNSSILDGFNPVYFNIKSLKSYPQLIAICSLSLKFMSM